MGKWFLGLDEGTDSVGWAVTDQNYQLIRRKGKDLWGVRKFEEAKSAAERRTFRINRRRKKREQIRLGILKNFFADEIDKVDGNFFIRMENSSLWLEDKDKRLNSKYSLFQDTNYTDYDYYHEYPTIYHLRKALLEGKQLDVRLVYLAIHNLFKRRGHFLFNGANSEINAENIDAIYDNLVDKLAENYDVYLLSGKANEFTTILSNRDISRREKLEKCVELFHITKKEKAYIYLKCMCGLSVATNEMFECEKEEKKNICFNKYSYNDEVPDLIDFIGEENYEIIYDMKQIYDYAALAEILKGYPYLSIARTEDYEKHKKDLKILKEIYKRYFSIEVYNDMFRSNIMYSYSAYVNFVFSDDSIAPAKRYRRNMQGKRQTEEFYKKVKKQLNTIDKKDKDIEYVLEEIEKETFLPKQLTGSNGIIPNQIHKRELDTILQNAKRYLPFLEEKDETGYSISEKISMLYSFQIPYYIGPTSINSKTGWVIRKENGLVLPWNIDEKIDIEATSEAFITNLIRECTYISGAKVLPKASLEYEAYCVLDEINNIRVNDERISVELKQSIYNDLFKLGKKVKRKNIFTYLKGKNVVTSEEQITGIDDEINNSLSSYGKMYSIFGDKLNEDKYKKIAEDIIYYGTIYCDARNMFTKRLQRYIDSGDLQEKDIIRISGFKFKDWARLSKTILEIQGIDISSGEKISLIRAMWNYNYNFMELINSDEFQFKKTLNEIRKDSFKNLQDISFDDFSDSYFSAPVKRMVWQTIQIVKELVDVMGDEPERIFIEMTRSDEEKGKRGRKDSRGKQLIELYKSIKDTEKHNWKDEIAKANESGSLRSKKLFLYYCQMGHDGYTGEEIDIEELFTTKYDIDHIYPRHYVKDDSLLNNLILVNKESNENDKKDLYPIPEKIISNPKVRELWETLHTKKLINDEKYHRLTNRNSFSDEQLAGFISRQLVETGQGAKGIADILQQTLKNTAIVYSKATNVSDFRRDNGFLKSRILNDFHHANDAYLNIVVGNVYYTKFTQNPFNFIKNEYFYDKKRYHYNLEKMFSWDVKRGDRVAWIAKKSNGLGSIDTITRMLAKNTPLCTKMSIVNTGAMYNIQPCSKWNAKAENYVPLKTKNNVMLDVKKYGGYTSLKPAYFIFIEYSKGKKREKAFDCVPVLYNEKIVNDSDLIMYCTDVLGYHDVRIIESRIKKYSLIKLDGYYLYLTGLDARKYIEVYNAVSLCLPRTLANYVHKVEKSKENGWMNTDITKEDNIRLYDYLINKHMNSILIKNPKPLGEILLKGKDRFETLSLEEQIDCLYKILLVSSCNSSTVDLKEIGGPSEAGRLRFSGNMTGRKELLLFNQSVTGIFQATPVNLLKR